MAAFNPPIDVPATMSIFILLFANALKTPQPKAPKDQDQIEQEEQTTTADDEEQGEEE